MSAIRVATRERMAPASWGLPEEEKFAINTYGRARAAVAYAKKLARESKITPQQRDRVLRRVHKRYPSLQIAPTTGFRMTLRK